jgi:D-tyrosyl-tRNA(Tyr) deacylase
VRAVIQRVTEARVTVGREIVGKIGAGLCVLLGVGNQDGEEHAKSLADKIKNLRIFEDDEGKMNRSITDTGGELLVVSQFTLYGDCRKGNRPSFSDAVPAAEADRLYQFSSKGCVIRASRSRPAPFKPT